MLFSPRYDSYRYEANYANYYRHVDYDADDLRFGRVEKSLDQQQKFPTHRRKRLAVGFFFSPASRTLRRI